MTVALLVLSGSLDNVPDCPELLNSNAGLSLLAQIVHHSVATRVQAAYIAWEAFGPAAAGAQHVSDVAHAILPPRAPRSLYQAADPSPPFA